MDLPTGEQGEIPNYIEALDDYMDEHQFTDERREQMFHFLDHSIVSAESALALLDIADRARNDVDDQMAMS